MTPPVVARCLAALLCATVGVPLAAPAQAADPSGAAGPPAPSIAQVGADVTVRPAGDLLAGPRRGAKAIRQLGDRLEVAAARNDLSAQRLRGLLRTDPTAWVDSTGALLYIDPRPEHEEHQHSEARPGGAHAPTSAAPVTAAAPLEETFTLHSNPGAQRTIFLDVDGTVVTGTGWNDEFGVASGFHDGWDPAGDGAAFNDDELALVQQVWALVAEDFAPFDVDVTTEDPGVEGLERSSGGDMVYGTRVLISDSVNAWDATCDMFCGGIAYISIYDQVGSYYQPAWVFSAGSDDVSFVAEAASHEAGHNLGLDHDGTPTQGYYEGHGSWAPIMGVGYWRPIAQWSRGSYPGAINGQDDVAILRGYLGTRSDEASGTVAAPAPIPPGTAYIGTADDVDAYLLGSCAGGTAVTVRVADLAPNLDVRAVLHDETGAQAQVAAPTSGFGDGMTATGMGAVLTIPAAGGDGWVVTVDGVGEGDFGSGGYDDYGSLGAYTVSAPGCTGELAAGAPAEPQSVQGVVEGQDALTLSWAEPSDVGDSPVTGYQLARSGDDAILTVGADARSHTFTGLTGGTTYDLSVRAVNSQGAGRPVVVSATTEAPPSRAPSVPRDLYGYYDADRDALAAYWVEPEDLGTEPLQGYSIYLDGDYIADFSPDTTGIEFFYDGGFPAGDHVVGVAAFSAAGASPIAEVTVTVDAPVRPDNDDVANATLLTGATGSVSGDNTHATAEPNDPVPPSSAAAGGYSVWYSWTPQVTAPVVMWTSGGGEGRDTTLAAYVGVPGELTRVAGDDDSGAGYHAQLAFYAQAGTRYLLAVDGFAGFSAGRGPFTLTWVHDAQEPDNEPPVVTTTLDPGTVEVGENDQQVTVSARVTDDGGVTLVEALSAQVIDSDLVQQASVPLTLVGGDALDQTYEGTLTVPAGSRPGTWNVSVRGVVDDQGAPQADAGGAATAHLTVTRTWPAPDAPTDVVARARVNSATVSWTHAFDHPDETDSRRYTVTASPGGSTCGTEGALTCTVGGLSNGRAYTFTVVASDANGVSAPSDPSSPVTPSIDTAPPVVESMTVEPGRVSSLGGQVEVEVVVTDDVSGIEDQPFGLTVIFTSDDGGQSFGFGGLPLVEGDDLHATFRGVVGVPAGTAPGTYHLSVYPIDDQAGNSLFFTRGPALQVGSPAAPDAPSAVAGERRTILARWPEPLDDGGQVITSYEVQTDVDLDPLTVDAAAATQNGLVTAVIDAMAVSATQPVRLRVRAVNAGGASDWSPWSAEVVVPATVPSPPTSVSAVAGDESATVTWAAPSDDGGSPVLAYEVAATPGGAVTTVPAGDLTAEVPGLSNGTAYSFVVRAVNAAGTSADSFVSGAVVPFGAPARPDRPKTTLRRTTLKVSWPAADGNGRPVDTYRVVLRKGKNERVVETGRTRATFKRLKRGKYTVKVVAIGEGGASQASRPAKVKVKARR